jgi:hypothetical protein
MMLVFVISKATRNQAEIQRVLQHRGDVKSCILHILIN